MVLGPFARVLAQVVVVAGGAIGRAVMNSFNEAAKRGAQHATLSQAISRKMTVEEACKILEIQLPTITKDKTLERSAYLIKQNQPEADYGGSPYLQKKIENSKIVLLEHLTKS